MTSPPEERYTIVERELSETLQRLYPDLAEHKMTYRVYDNQKDAYVSFGNHRDKDAAHRHIARLKARDGGTERA